MGKDGKEYLVETNALDSGKLTPEQDGALLNAEVMDRSVIVKGGFYYEMDRKAGKLVKYQIKGEELTTADTLPLDRFSIENSFWAGGDTLLLTGLKTPDFAQAAYALLTTGNMKLIASGNMEIPRPFGRFETMSIGFVKMQGKKLLVGYTYHQQLSPSEYTTSDTIYVTSLSYPQMKSVKTDRDHRSTYPGGMNTIQSSSFADEHGDFYFMACPGIALGNRPQLPTAILKIGRGTDQPDKKYLFNLSLALHNHAYGMWYLGNGQAIVRSERKDLFKGLDDHYSTAHFEFYLVDVLTQKVIKKLDFPLDKGTRRECVFVEGNIAYISINSSTEGNYVWEYNIRTATLKKGLKMAGNTDYILRIDRLR